MINEVNRQASNLRAALNTLIECSNDETWGWAMNEMDEEVAAKFGRVLEAIDKATSELERLVKDHDRT